MADDPARTLEQVLGAKDYFGVFGLPRKKVKVSVLRSIYKKIALLIHPDKNNSPFALTAFKRLNAAHESLNTENAQLQYLYTLPTEKQTKGKGSQRHPRKRKYGNRGKYESSFSDEKSGPKWWEQKDWIEHIERETEAFKRQNEKRREKMKEERLRRKRHRATYNNKRIQDNLRHLREKYGLLDSSSVSSVSTDSRFHKEPKSQAETKTQSAKTEVVYSEDRKQFWCVMQIWREWKRELEHRREKLKAVKEELRKHRETLRGHLKDSREAILDIKAASQQDIHTVEETDKIVRSTIKDMQTQFQNMKESFDSECDRHRCIKTLQEKLRIKLDKEEGRHNSKEIESPIRDRLICWVCRRKFASVEKRKSHVRKSDLHAKNTASLRASFVSLVTKEKASATDESSSNKAVDY